MADALKTVTLDNGIRIVFYDQSNRYFGDFHRLCIKVVIELPVDYELPPGVDREKIRFERTLEKMGMPTAEVESGCAALVESFLLNSSAYLGRSEFPRQLLAKVQQQNRKSVTTLFNR